MKEKTEFLRYFYGVKFWNFKVVPYFEIVTKNVETVPEFSTDMVLHNASHRKSIPVPIHEIYILFDVIDVVRQQFFGWESISSPRYGAKHIKLKS